MINLLIVGLLFIGMASVASYSMLQMTESTQKMVRAQNERQLLDQWETAVTNGLKPLAENQQLAAPFGFNDPTDADADTNPDLFHHTMPNGFSLPKVNAWGRPFIYCPISDQALHGGVTDTAEVWTAITPTDTSDYMVGLARDHNNTAYVAYSDQVMHSSLNGRGVVAMIISPLAKTTTLPRCHDVQYDTASNSYKVSGALVRVITRDTVLSSKVGQPVLVDAQDFATSATLNDMASTWPSTQPLRFVIQLPTRADDYDLQQDLDFVNAYSSDNKEIVLLGGGSGSTTVSASNNQKLTFKNASVHLEGITFNSKVKVEVEGGQLTTKDVVFSGLSLNKSQWFIEGTVRVNKSPYTEHTLSVQQSEIIQTNQAVTIETDLLREADIETSQWIANGGSISFESGLLGQQAIALKKNSKWIADGTAISFSAPGSLKLGSQLVSVDSTSQTNLDNLTVTVSDPHNRIFLAQGQLYLDNVNVNLTKNITEAIKLSHGGILSLNNSVIASGTTVPNYGVVDQGGRFLFGSSSTVKGSTKCWSGNLFTSVASETTGSSQPTLPDYQIFNQSNWTCNP